MDSTLEFNPRSQKRDPEHPESKGAHCQGKCGHLKTHLKAGPCQSSSVSSKLGGGFQGGWERLAGGEAGEGEDGDVVFLAEVLGGLGDLGCG